MTDFTSTPPIYTPATLTSPRRPLVFAILAGLGLLFAGCGVGAIYLALGADAPLLFRILLCVVGAVFLSLPGTFAFVSVRRKWMTGRWTLSPAERMERFRIIGARPPSRASRIISSPRFTLALNLMMIAIACEFVWLAVRSGFHPFDSVMAVFWIGIAAQAVWQISRLRTNLSA